MAVREFNGSTDYIRLDNGILAGVNNNQAISFVLIVKPLTLDNATCFLTVGEGVSKNVVALYDSVSSGSGYVAWGSDDPASDEVANVGMTANAWQVLGLSKAAGSSIPRLHRKVLGSGSWSHVSAGTAVGNYSGATCDRIEAARFVNGVGYKNMRLAVAAIFTDNLSDANFEAIESNATTAYINSLGPEVLCDFNQATVSTPVVDLTGNGSDEIARSGTTVITGDDPAWTFGLAAAEKQTYYASRRRSWR